MKDKHTINLILISSKWVIFSFGVCSWWINSSSKCFHLFFSGVQFPRSSRWNLHLNHRNAHLILSSFILSRHPFVTGVLHGGSSWFNSFFKSSSRFLLAEFKYLFFSHLEVQLILRILLKWSFAFLRSSQLFNLFCSCSIITS